MYTTISKLLRLLVIFSLVISSLVFLPGKTVTAVTYPTPPWWDGVSCDDTNYFAETGVHATVLSEWNGVQACGPRPDGDSGPNLEVQFSPSGSAQHEWQCPELVKRYLLMAFSKTALAANGDAVVSVYATDHPDTFDEVANDGAAQKFPSAGDVISYSTNHTALITAVTDKDYVNGDAVLTLLEQNGSASGTTTQQFDAWIIRGDSDDPDASEADTITGWLTPVWGAQTSPNPSSNNNLTAVTALSSSEAWAVGPGLATHTTDGTTWGSNTIPANYLSYTLAGVSAVSSSNVVSVGKVYSGGANYAVALKYNGSTWSALTIDRPGASSWLNGVSTGSGGDTWAVGYTLQSGYRPLFEHYNGTSAFTKVQDPFPFVSGSTDTRLTAVSVLSSSDAWAVGYYVSSNSARPITVHYTGGNWGYVTTPTPTLPPGITTYDSKLYGVKVIASDDVWAVGYYSYMNGQTLVTLPFAMHWDGSSWDTSEQPLPLLGGYLTGVHAASSSTVYAVGLTAAVGNNGGGGTYARPLVFRYNGTNWVEISVPTVLDEMFNGVAVTGSSTDDPIWAVGGQRYNSTYTLIQQGRVK